MTVDVAGLHGNASSVWLYSMSVRRGGRDAFVLACRLKNRIAIWVGVRHRQRVWNALVVSPASVPNLVPRSSFFVRKSNQRLRQFICKVDTEVVHQPKLAARERCIIERDLRDNELS